MIVLEGVSRTYQDTAKPVRALRTLSVTIAQGTMVAIVGPSGSGKSTLLNLLGALDRPTQGKISIDGAELTTMDDNARTRIRREKIGFVFQFFNLLPTLTARENVLLPARLAGHRDKATEARADELLARVGLGERKGHRPDMLSGGEMQRVAVARALIMDPPLVLADEPTGNLDTHTGEEVLKLLKGAVDAKRTVVLVTHDTRIAERADRILTIRDGELVGDTAPPKGTAVVAETANP